MELHVVYCTDSKYSKIMTVSIVSLCESNKSFSQINIYCFEKDLTEYEKEKIEAIVGEYGRKITFISINTYCNELRFWPKSRDLMFSRFLIPNVLNEEKVLYLDCDTIVISSLEELWNMDITGYVHLVVLDTARCNAKHEASLKNNDKYFNSGVMVINCSEWKNKDIFKKMKIYESKQNKLALFPDQRPLNAVTLKYSKIISPAYNLTSELFHYSYEQIIKIMKCDNFYSKKDLEEAIKRPIIIHFSGRSIDRPWFSNCKNIYKEKYRSYMKKYEFTDFPLWRDDILSVIKWNIKYSLPVNVQIFISFLIEKVQYLKGK